MSADLAGAAPMAPGAAELAGLKAALARAPAVRVTSGATAYVLRDVALDESGIPSARWGPGATSRPALIVMRGALPPATPPRISWSDISRIETGRTNAGRLAVIGLLVGELVGTVVWNVIPLGADGGRGPAPLVIAVPASATLLFGAFLGSQEYRWSRVHGRTDP